MSRKIETYGRNSARRYLSKIVKMYGLTVTRRQGTIWWFINDKKGRRINCSRYGRYTLRRLP